jgi:hypothetical protein
MYLQCKVLEYFSSDESLRRYTLYITKTYGEVCHVDMAAKDSSASTEAGSGNEDADTTE